jgi:sortase A
VRAVRTLLHGLGELLITLGVVVLLFVAWQLWWTDVAAGRTQTATVHQVERRWAVAQPTTGSAAGTSVRGVPTGQPVALLRIPRFGKEYVRPVLQGVDLDVLDDGVGHYPDSAGPGQVGNFALAGHRVTYAKPFNRIAELRRGDQVIVQTRDTSYVYTVLRSTVVTPEQVDVVAPVPQHAGERPTRRLLTMTACHPKYSARQRYVVFAELERSQRRTAADVPAATR